VQEAILGLVTRYPRLSAVAGGHEHHAIPSFRGLRVFRVRVA